MIERAQRRVITRRDLERSPGFTELSPEVGELDSSAVMEGLTGDDADEILAMLADLTAAADERLRALAKRLAAQIFVDLARIGRPTGGGIGRMTSERYRPDEGDIDLDGSMDGIVRARATRSAFEEEDLRIVDWAEATTAWCLLVDRSGSMAGRSLATAALAAAAISARAEHDYAVLSFSGDVIAVRSMDEHRPIEAVVDRVLALRGHGITDVAAALQAAADQFRRVSAGRRITVLLSDCRATRPGDVVRAAELLDELVIVAPDGDSHEAQMLAERNRVVAQRRPQRLTERWLVGVSSGADGVAIR